jgi:hypothetical protein
MFSQERPFWGQRKDSDDDVPTLLLATLRAVILALGLPMAGLAREQEPTTSICIGTTRIARVIARAFAAIKLPVRTILDEEGNGAEMCRQGPIVALVEHGIGVVRLLQDPRLIPKRRRLGVVDGVEEFHHAHVLFLVPLQDLDGGVGRTWEENPKIFRNRSVEIWPTTLVGSWEKAMLWAETPSRISM